jgi:hypothetical protein
MMILYKTQVNEVIVTVTERVTLSSPVFLFSFESDATNDITTCLAQNISNTTERSDEFLIEEKASPDNLVGEIELPAGTYTYRIYEQTSTTNLDPESATSLLEEGQCRVIGEEETDTEYSNNTTNTVYEG